MSPFPVVDGPCLSTVLYPEIFDIIDTKIVLPMLFGNGPQQRSVIICYRKHLLRSMFCERGATSNRERPSVSERDRLFDELQLDFSVEPSAFDLLETYRMLVLSGTFWWAALDVMVTTAFRVSVQAYFDTYVLSLVYRAASLHCCIPCIPCVPLMRSI